MGRMWLYAATCVVAMGVGEKAEAHGGVSMEDDICLMKLGPFRSHFTGYQPEKRSTQEFCEDIPETGNVVMVMDFMSDELRAMQTDFRIIRDVKKIGITATLEDLGAEEDIRKATVFYKEPSRYPHGTLSASYRFEGEGMFIGMVTATADDGTKYVSVFPFSVGVRTYWRYLVMLAVSFAAAFALYRYATRG